MSKWFLPQEEDDNGCGYTIGCGQRVTEIAPEPDDSAPIESALAEVYGADPDDECGRGPFNEGEHKLTECTLLCVESTFDLLPIMRARQTTWQLAKDRAAASASEDVERAEFARLRAKYGGG